MREAIAYIASEPTEPTCNHAVQKKNLPRFCIEFFSYTCTYTCRCIFYRSGYANMEYYSLLV
jgi:hypothetical protein